MRRLLHLVAPVVHLTRVTSAFAAVANVWFVVLWSRRAAPFEPGTPELDRPLWVLLLCSAASALGLFAFSATINDLLDFRRDRALHPDRPLPSGRITIDAALALVLVTLLTAVLGAAFLGTHAVLLTILVAASIFFLHATAKHIPAFGLVLVGLIYAAQMLIPNFNLRFLWPVWLVMTHSMLVAAVTHTLAHRVPGVSRRATVAAVAGWAVWSGVLFYAAYRRNSGEPGAWWGLGAGWGTHGATPGAGAAPAGTGWWERLVWAGGDGGGGGWGLGGWGGAIIPAMLAIAFLFLIRRKLRRYGRGTRAAEKIARYGSLWLALYACAWLVGRGFWSEALILVSLTAAGVLGMTVLREVYSMLRHPLEYRR